MLERPLEDIVEPSLLSDFYEFVGGHYVFMRLYDPVSSQFRLSYLEKVTGRSLDKSCMDEVHRLTGGLWRLTKICAEAMLAEEKHADELLPFLLSRKTVKEALCKIWDSFTPDEQTALRTYMDGKIDPDTQMQEYLSKIGIIKDTVLQIPFLKEIIGQKEVVAQCDEHIIYDIDTNMIRKGDTEISDRLTAAEYRLLLFCLQNTERILERDEIITAVWRDSATTAGVTDQALDQLIFRVRKKIEADPNNPLHLQTVKGRGFKFSS
jgi:DNA-binding winged helix-turn-helix (wHTH) protein